MEIYRFIEETMEDNIMLINFVKAKRMQFYYYYFYFLDVMRISITLVSHPKLSGNT